LRALLVEIYPPNLEAAGLNAALLDLAGTLVSSDCDISVDVDEAAAARLSPEATEAVFRVAQEALRNAVKHAGASVVTVRVYDDGEQVCLAVDDDGIGFDTEATLDRADAERGGHLGLDLLVDAALRVGASLKIASSPGNGTSYLMEVDHT